ncbi:MAG: hypothetical protein SPC26_04650, partial [Lactobacillus amylovorus]|nr:hypothetical protein [Lactobacillus amylovorus]
STTVVSVSTWRRRFDSVHQHSRLIYFLKQSTKGGTPTYYDVLPLALIVRNDVKLSIFTLG